MKKYCLDLSVISVEQINENYVLIKLTHSLPLPPMLPGQFVEVRVEHSPSTFLRRPISINFIDSERNELWLLVATVGDGTRQMARLKPGERLNCILPLGKAFSLPASPSERFLLVGGGVGVAPLLFLGQKIREMGAIPIFLLGARTKNALLEMEAFERIGRVWVTTEDGSAGERGFVTQHSVLQRERFDRICTCGPKPMIMAVARYAAKEDIACEVSLENMMACGIGACLCCVEKTTDGNRCVCTEGPVFDTRQLLWT